MYAKCKICKLHLNTNSGKHVNSSTIYTLVWIFERIAVYAFQLSQQAHINKGTFFLKKRWQMSNFTNLHIYESIND